MRLPATPTSRSNGSLAIASSAVNAAASSRVGPSMTAQVERGLEIGAVKPEARLSAGGVRPGALDGLRERLSRGRKLALIDL